VFGDVVVASTRVMRHVTHGVFSFNLLSLASSTILAVLDLVHGRAGHPLSDAAIRPALL
jgi:hypothetical protein